MKSEVAANLGHSIKCTQVVKTLLIPKTENGAVAGYAAEILRPPIEMTSAERVLLRAAGAGNR